MADNIQIVRPGLEEISTNTTIAPTVGSLEELIISDTAIAWTSAADQSVEMLIPSSIKDHNIVNDLKIQCLQTGYPSSGQYADLIGNDDTILSTTGKLSTVSESTVTIPINMKKSEIKSVRLTNMGGGLYWGINSIIGFSYTMILIESDRREKGSTYYSGNYEPQKAAPLDARMTSKTYEALLFEETWLALDGKNYAYPGMTVSVWGDIDENNGIYMLKALPVTESSNWMRAGGGGGIMFTNEIDEETGELIGVLTLT